MKTQNSVWDYLLQWEQNMGNGRGMNMEIKTLDYESAHFVWKNLCKDKLESEVRNVRAWVCKGHGPYEQFDPNQPWPRPSAIMPF